VVDLPQSLSDLIEGYSHDEEAAWTTPSAAYNQCSKASYFFQEFGERIGSPCVIEVVNGNVREILGNAPGFDLTPRDNRLPATGHTVTHVTVDGRTFLVDWTAPQYMVIDPWPYVEEVQPS
jgi:hypothetical protein